MKTVAKDRSLKLATRSKSIERQCYLLLALPLIGFFVFTLYPMVWSMLKAFYFYDQVPSHTKFVGIENFITLFTKETAYWKAWGGTFKFMIYKLPIEIFFALILAVILHKGIKGAGFFRAFYYMPNVISSVLVGVVFMNIFDYFGFINNFLVNIGLIDKSIDWFGGANSAFWVLAIGSIWNCFGVNVMYFSAALTNVPDDLYEAAEIDGAGGMRKFFNITLPMIAPVFQTILLLGINGTLHMGDYIIAMTNGAPGGATHTAASYIIAKFLPGFASETPNLGYGCAMSLVSSLIYGLVAVIYNKFTAKMQDLY